jgi:hypothetical protein
MGTQLRAMSPPDERVSMGCESRDNCKHTLVDGVAGDRVLVAFDTADDGEAGAALADRDVQAGDVDADERLDERRDDRVARVLHGLAALRRARRRATRAAAVRCGRREGESGEAGEGEGEDLGEHREDESVEAGVGKCRLLSWRPRVGFVTSFYARQCSAHHSDFATWFAWPFVVGCKLNRYTAADTC